MPSKGYTMRFERWRGMPLVLAMAALGLGLSWADRARADGYRLHPTIPKDAPAYDFTTGGEFMAPPVPYGHYAKGGLLGAKGGLLGCAGCRLHGLLGCLGCGHDGAGHGGGSGLFGHGQGGGDPGCDVAGCGGGLGHHHKAGRFAPCDSGAVVVYGGTPVVATSQSFPAGTAVVQPSSQFPCGLGGCGVKDPHSHGHNRLCGRCKGQGCGGCGGAGILDGCGDPGCGLCHGKGKGCGFCGGKGCSHCLSSLHGKIAGLLHLGPKVDYFVGAGGPVPITPGYVPYIVATRSPRDFFSFPPMNPYDP
jgi:hypothetical protein